MKLDGNAWHQYAPGAKPQGQSARHSRACLGLCDGAFAQQPGHGGSLIIESGPWV